MSAVRLPFRGDPISRMASVVLICLLLMGILGQWFGLGGSPTESVGPRLAGPSWEWPLGTDALGRSIFPRVIDGIGTTVVLAGVSVLIASAVGTALGIVAAYAGGVVDQTIARFADVMFSFPVILLAILIAAVLGPGELPAVVAIVFASIPLLLRVVRSTTLDVVGADFVRSAQVGGTSRPRILGVHILPNVAGAAIVQATYALSVGMLIESALSFLGLGVQDPDASLGSLLQDNRVYLAVRPWSVLGPGLVLALAILSVNLIGDGMRDSLETRETRSLT